MRALQVVNIQDARRVEILNNWFWIIYDNKVGGAVATGLGEEVIKTVGSFLVVELMRQGFTPQEACESAVKNSFK